jgi:hypothetical protein
MTTDNIEQESTSIDLGEMAVKNFNWGVSTLVCEHGPEVLTEVIRYGRHAVTCNPDEWTLYLKSGTRRGG